MTDDQHAEGAPGSGGRWNPLPQGDYDDGATAFVKLPEGGIDALLAADSPLAAPGHGYVPPQITVTPASPAATDPSATGGWAVPAEGAQWPDPNAVPQDGNGDAGADDRFAYHPEATQQWTFQDDHTQAQGQAQAHSQGRSQAQPPSPAPGHDVTGQWSIPVAGGDLPDESGEFTTSSLVQQWGGTPPPTLPGGAAAPWATEAIGQPWARPPQDPADGAYDGGAYDGEPAAHPYPAEPATTAQHPEAPTARDEHPEHRRHPESEPEPESGAPAATRSAARDAEAVQPGAGPSRPSGPSGAPEADESPEHVRGAVQAPVEPAEGAAGRPAAQDPAEESADPRQAAEEPVTASDPTAPDADPADPTDAHQEAAAADGPPPAAPQDEHPLASYVLSVNGVDRPVTDAWIGESLLYVLRERLGLAGAKDGCSQGECGACNVRVDGRLVASCLVPAVTAAGSEVRTVEGLAVDGQPSDVQRALARCGAVQCGFCVPGMAMTVHDLLEGNPAPTELETRQALCGNLCRCSGYKGVLRAVEEVVAEREAHAAAEHAAADGGETDAGEPRIPHQAGPGAGGIHPSAFGAPAPHGPDEPHGHPDPHGHHHDPHGHHDPHDPYGHDGGQA
ncbi:2Fe-2S iron-sulfur cluster-binding protein [Streptomyces sp. NRRL S-813]|uniref:2Fe-2S iron-sulfur cluster-binding protein n=1 Tax=Streptomyces sp. NRRL S-813 TaxID=1463919 RepID=UPI0004C03EE0|nr:2Fe-2S iron-sulfur cluster-binding protein [Streptomyces sp. NRRL S-813]